MRYSAFGESSNNSRSPWRFSSKRFDPETGFVYFGRRYYMPETGHWLTPDPTGFEDGINLYAYVHQSPLTHIDPDGQFAFLVPIIVSMALPCAVEYALPYATVYLSQYACGATASAALTGLAHGFSGNYAYSELLFDSATMSGAEHVGLAMAVILNNLPSRVAGKTTEKVASFAKERFSAYVKGQIATRSLRAVTSLSENSARQAASDAVISTADKTREIASREGIFKYVEKQSNPSFPEKIDLDTLSEAGQSLDRQGLTRAGRSLIKHGFGNRSGNVLFPKPQGNPSQINMKAQEVLDDILTMPGTQLQKNYRGRFGETLEVMDPNGRGVVYDSKGNFLFFRE